MSAQAALRHCLECGDVDDFRALNAQVFPHHTQPESREQAEIALHHARTQAEFLTLRHRAYSHRWLTERGLPSGLPDRLKPSAERLYPRIVDAVGVAVKASSAILKPAVPLIRQAMCDAVEDAYAEGRKEPEFVKARMSEARAKTLQALFGRANHIGA